MIPTLRALLHDPRFILTLMTQLTTTRTTMPRRQLRLFWSLLLLCMLWWFLLLPWLLPRPNRLLSVRCFSPHSMSLITIS